jgi:hypothetical protein
MISYIKNGRDLGAWVHTDITFQAYLFAAQWLLTHGATLNPGNPYLAIKNQVGVQTFGSQYVLDLLGEVSNRALKAMWYQKWFVHRTLRPAKYGGLVHNTRALQNIPFTGRFSGPRQSRRLSPSTGRICCRRRAPKGVPRIPLTARVTG